MGSSKRAIKTQRVSEETETRRRLKKGKARGRLFGRENGRNRVRSAGVEAARLRVCAIWRGVVLVLRKQHQEERPLSLRPCYVTALSMFEADQTIIGHGTQEKKTKTLKKNRMAENQLSNPFWNAYLPLPSSPEEVTG